MVSHLCKSVWNSRTKHTTHVAIFLVHLTAFEIGMGGLMTTYNSDNYFDPVARYGLLLCVILYALRLCTILAVPQCIFNFLGLICFNAFEDDVELKSAPLLAPFICMRVVTKGDFPNLVARNVESNISTCLKAGMEHFVFEVVTDKALHLKRSTRLREIVVPPDYRTRTGAMFKARALQYCWENGVSELLDNDWIVHLDEETVMTEGAVHGILNFCSEGKYHFGQGLITYANGKVVNWITTLADSFRVADDMGKIRFQLRIFEKPLFGWKGSYLVAKASAERAVSFDHGLRGSIAEDCYFAMVAYRDGYRFQFIEGEMRETSAFTLWDFLQQRKRWIQGLCMVVYCPKLPWRFKFLLAMSMYAWVLMPFMICNTFVTSLWPLPKHVLLDFVVAFAGAVNFYMYVFGIWKSVAAKCRRPLTMLYYTVGAISVMPLGIIIETIAVFLAFISSRNKFYVVQKDPLSWIA